MGQQTMAASLGIHVTGDLGMNRVEPLSAITSCLPGPVTTPPGSWTTGGSNHAGPSWPTPSLPGVTNKVTGGVDQVCGVLRYVGRRLPGSLFLT